MTWILFHFNQLTNGYNLIIIAVLVSILIILISYFYYKKFMEKECFKCKKTLPLSSFYKHPQMGDGHLNKCKECNKIDVKANYKSNLCKPGYKEKERKRGRDKYHRIYGPGYNFAKPENNERWISKFPEKILASKNSASIKASIGFEKHHWSYNEPHWKDIIELTKPDHMKAHRFLFYDQERMMYRKFDTFELLDTKEKHFSYINHCIKNYED